MPSRSLYNGPHLLYCWAQSGGWAQSMHTFKVYSYKFWCSLVWRKSTVTVNVWICNLSGTAFPGGHKVGQPLSIAVVYYGRTKHSKQNVRLWIPRLYIGHAAFCHYMKVCTVYFSLQYSRSGSAVTRFSHAAEAWNCDHEQCMIIFFSFVYCTATNGGCAWRQTTA